MKKSVKCFCTHCQKETTILTSNDITDDCIFVCEDCYDSPQNPPYTEDDLYYQYIEDHYILEQRLEDTYND